MKADAGNTDLQLMADLFHGLNQPITALHCALELSLQRPRSEKQYRHTLRLALEQAGQIAHQVAGIRDLMHAGDAGDRMQVIDLTHFLREAVNDLRPVAESMGMRLSLHAPTAHEIHAEPQRIRQAMFSALEFMLQSCAPSEPVLVDVGEQDMDVELRLTGLLADAIDLASSEASLQPGPRVRVAIARRILEAVGGHLHLHADGRRLQMSIRLSTVRRGESAFHS